MWKDNLSSFCKILHKSNTILLDIGILLFLILPGFPPVDNSITTIPTLEHQEPNWLDQKEKKATQATAKHNSNGQKKMTPQKTQMSVSSMDWEVSLAQIPIPIAQTIIPMRYMDNAVTIVIVYILPV